MLPRLAFRKKLLRIGIVIGVLILLTYIFTIYYITTQRNEVAGLIIKVINERYPGDIEFDDVTVDKWVGLPAPALSFSNLTIRDSTENLRFLLKAKKVDILLSITDLLKQKVHLKSISFTDGQIDLNNYTPLSPEEIMEIPPKLDSLKLEQNLNNLYFEKDTKLFLSDIAVRIRHHVKDKLYEFHIKEIRSDLDFRDNMVFSNTDLDMNVQTLGFNLSKGHYINGSNVTAAFNSTFDLSKSQWSIAPFVLKIGEQEFNSKAEFNFKGWGAFDIELENNDTNFGSTLDLLTDNLQEKLSMLKMERPVYTKARLQGNFVFRDNPFIEVSFKTTDNILMVDNRIPVEVVSISGKIVNRIYDDYRADTEPKRNLRIQLSEFKGKYGDITIDLINPLYTSSEEAENYFESEVLAKGPAEDLNDLLSNQLLSFRSGNFELNATVSGDIDDFEDFVSSSSSSFVLNDTQVINNGNSVGITVNRMNLSLKDDLAQLEKLVVQLNPKNEVLLTGEINNFSGLFEGENGKSRNSRLQIKSENLAWKDFVKIFDVAQSRNNYGKPELVLQDALRRLYSNYNPTFSVALDRFNYGDIEMENFRTAIRFENQDRLLLQNTNFDIEGGHISLDASIAIDNTDAIVMNAQLSGNGSIEVLNNVFNEDKLTFSGGSFDVDANIRGNLLELDRILSNSSGKLVINSTDITYDPLNLILPANNIDLSFESDHAELNEISFALGKEEEVIFKGGIQNLSTLLFKNVDKKVSSDLNVYSKKLVWEDFLGLFALKSDKRVPSPLVSAEARLKLILQDIQGSLNPSLTVNIEELKYSEMPVFRNFKSGLYFKNENTVVLEETNFTYADNTQVSLEALFDIGDPDETIVDMALNASGDPGHLNDVLNNDTFLFESGVFEVDAFVKGDITQLDSLVATSQSNLRVKNSAVLHKPSRVMIPFKSLYVQIKDNTASLKNFTVEMASGDQLRFTGQVEHISDLIFDVPAEQSKATSSITAFSEKLTFIDFLQLFEGRQVGTGNNQTITEKNAIKPTIRDVYIKFKPRLRVGINEFQLGDLILNNLKTGFFFENENLLYLEDTGFTFYDGRVNLDALLNISDPDRTSFAFGFTAEKLDLERVLESFDYFNLDAFKNSEKIGGKVTMNTEIGGEFIDSLGIDFKTLNGELQFELEEAQIKGFEPIIKVASKVFKKERFEDIRFSPIENTFYLSNNAVEIPQMEIQSTAINLFIEGQLGFVDEKTNILTGIPLANFKKRDLVNIPDKKGSIAAGSKIYIQAKSDNKDEIKYVLQLSPRNYYKERGNLSEYRTAIKEERKQRREYRRATRSNSKDSNSDNSPD